MTTLKDMRRPIALAAGIVVMGALASFGSTPAFATYSQIYGSGASIESQLQNNILIPDSGISPAPIFTPDGDLSGLTEFGNAIGLLNPTEDPVAGRLYPPQLDAYVTAGTPPDGARDSLGNRPIRGQAGIRD
jgi:hypothetical protein